MSSRSSAPGHSRTLRTCLALCALALWLLLPGRPAAVRAQGDWQIVSQTIDATFSESLDVTLKVQAPAVVEKVVFFYGRVGDRIVRRIYPDFGPSANLDITYSEPLERGQYAPGTDLRAWWQLTDEAGDTLVTPELTIRYEDEAQDWATLDGDQATLHYYGVLKSRASTWLQAAEDSLQTIGDDFGVSAEAPIDIYVYRTEADMRSALATRSDDYDARVTTLGVAVDEDTLIVLGAQSDLEATMAHELTHIVVGMYTDNPYAGLPRWLDEGLAMVAEGELPRNNQQALDRGIASDALLSVRSMTTYSGQASEVDLYYGECYSVVSYLIDAYGRDQLTTLLETFAQGTSQDAALRAVYGFDVEELDSLWRVSLGLTPRTLPVTPTPSAD